MLTYIVQGQNIFKSVNPPITNYNEEEFKKELEELMKKRNIQTLKAEYRENPDAQV